MTLKPAHLICATLLLIMGIANAQPVRKALVEAQISRPDSAKPVYIRGALDRAPESNAKVLLFYRGYPGIARIDGSDGQVKFLNAQEHFEEMLPVFLNAGISTVTLDCPPPRQNTCRLHRFQRTGAMMERRDGSIRTSFQEQGAGQAAATEHSLFGGHLFGGRCVC